MNPKFIFLIVVVAGFVTNGSSFADSGPKSEIPDYMIAAEGNVALLNWSPRGDYITFFADWDGDREIYVIRPDGSGIRQLTFNDYKDWTPAFSKDGTKIFYSSFESGDYDVYQLDLETGETTFLFGTPGEREVRPQEISVGKISFNKGPFGPGRNIMVWDSKTNQIEALVVSPQNEGWGQWSPKGDVFVFSRDFNEDEYDLTELYVVDWDGSNERQITFYPSGKAGSGSYAMGFFPDGKRILYYSDKDSDYDRSKFYILTLENGEETVLPRMPDVFFGFPSLSPDGREMVFAGDFDKDDKKELLKMDVGGKVIQEIWPRQRVVWRNDENPEGKEEN